MNGQSSQMADLERALRALAEDDCHVQAPPHVQASVMQTWDALLPRGQHRHRRSPSRRAVLLAIGSIAAAVAVVVVMYRAPLAPSRPEPVLARAVDKLRIVPNVRPADADPPAEAHRLRPRRPRPRGETAAPRYGPGMVLVADPILDASAASIVRIRVRRTALMTLGIPLVEADDRGSVDLEMLVGEDGVARTIRRVVPVVTRQE
jgi:hypothetical protein